MAKEFERQKHCKNTLLCRKYKLEQNVEPKIKYKRFLVGSHFDYKKPRFQLHMQTIIGKIHYLWQGRLY